VYIDTTKRLIIRRQSISLTEPTVEWQKIQVERKESYSKIELVNDLIRQAKNLQREIDLIRTKLEKAEQGGYTNDLLAEIFKQSKELANG